MAPIVFVCVGCGLFGFAERADALTCSTACRVRAHRNGRLKQIRAMASSAKIAPGMYVQALAVLRLCPHLGEELETGRLDLEDTRQQVWAALWRRIEAAARATISSED
jgi:hypothetical protein